MICIHCKKEISINYGNQTCPNCHNNIIYEQEIRKFDSGAVRDSDKNKESYVETISWVAFRRYSQYMTGKKNKYGAGNFKKGIPIESYEESLVRHLVKYLSNKYENEDLEKNEDHLSAIIFNTFGIMHEEEQKRIKNINSVALNH